MKRLWIFSIVLLWAGLGLLSICAGGSVSTAKTSPDRIVSLGPNLSEILFELGLEEKIVAVSADSDWPPQAADKIKVGTFWQPNPEAIIAVRPDLVITLSFEQQRGLAERLKRIGYNTLTVRIETIEELFAAILEIGKAVRHESRARTLVTNLKAGLEQLSGRLAEKKKLKVLWAVQTDPLRVAGRKTFINDLIELAGGENAIGPTIHQYPPIGAEQVIASGAEVIIQPAMNMGIRTEDLDKQQGEAVRFFSKFRTLPAVKNSRIYTVPPDTVSRLGPRICDGAEMIAKYLHPDVFVSQDNSQ